VAVERLVPGDEVWSRPDNAPEWPCEWKAVEDVFERQAAIWELVVGGRELATTGEHPFYVRGKGWQKAEEVVAGSELLGKDGEWTVVDVSQLSGRTATVYNCRVAEYHTYFVGGEEWGFSVWAHNLCYSYEISPNPWNATAVNNKSTRIYGNPAFVKGDLFMRNSYKVKGIGGWWDLFVHGEFETGSPGVKLADDVWRPIEVGVLVDALLSA
jgi:hypothetical protein